MVGFKSFKDKTVVYFNAKTTGIVGPNGCGKSNIVDALLWVMGEMSAKYLRGNSMSDVIFMGSENYAPAGYAEVSVFLENDGGPFPAAYADRSEIVITRRLHRNGESEYLINNEPSRLRDIHEIFMDTGAGAKGFSIIEQGAIGKVITAKPEERRSLVEEAAGITKFRTRKRESERKLKSTAQNLLRLEDILKEQQRQLSSLEKQSQKAEKYRDLKEELETKELWLNSQKFLQFKKDLEDNQQCLMSYKQEEAGLQASVDEKQLKAESLKSLLSEKESSIHNKQSDFEKLRQSVIQEEKALRELEFEVKHIEKEEEMSMSLFQQKSRKKESFEKEEEGLRNNLENVLKESGLLQDYENKKNAVQSYQDKILKLEDSCEALQEKIISQTQEHSSLKAKVENQEKMVQEKRNHLSSQEGKLKEFFRERESWGQKRKKCQERLAKAQQMYLEILKDTEVYQNNISQIEQKEKETEDHLESLKENYSEVLGKLSGFEELNKSFEGFQEGVRNLLLWKEKHKKDGFIPLIKTLEVPQNLETVVECALSERLQVLLVSKNSESLEALEHLRRQSLGRSSLLSQEMLSIELPMEVDRERLGKEQGFVSFLSDALKAKDEFSSHARFLLKDIVVVENLEAALRLKKAYKSYTFITLKAEKLTQEGVLVGGSQPREDEGLLRRARKIKELSLKKETLKGQMELEKTSLKKLKSQKKSLFSEKDNIQKLQGDNELEKVAIKKDIEALDQSLKEIQSRYETEELSFRGEREKLEKLLEEIESLTLRLEKVEVQQEADKEERKSLLHILSQSKVDFEREKKALNETELKKSSFDQKRTYLEEQHLKAKEALLELNSELESLKERSLENQKAISTKTSEIVERKEKLEAVIEKSQYAQTTLSQSQETYSQVSQECRSLEEDVYKARRTLSDFQTKLNEAQLKAEQAQMKLQYIVEQTEEKYSVSLAQKASSYTQDYDQNEVASEIEKYKKQLAQIGAVNLVAFKEYEEAKERHAFLEKQHQDLISSKDELRTVIDKIDKICAKRFKESYEKINAQFQKVFPVLFGGGQARLCLVENPEMEVDEEPGIGIEAQPPGKKLQNVGLLSGGEKALTAVSLIFSIFLVKPSPFCLLDEVDAPLDDANVARFNELVKEMARRSQVIVVTHNKHTMRFNNKLYGVTMQEKGVSKMVSVELDAAEKLAETGSSASDSLSL